MLGRSTDTRASGAEDPYRGAQYDLILRGSGFLGIVGALAALAITPFYPPTAQIGAVGWLLVIPGCAVGIATGVLSLTLRHHPSVTAIHASSFTGAAQIALLQWLAGGGKAPYLQLLVLPMLGAGVSQPLGRCAHVVIAAWLAALSPLLYSDVDVLATVTEFTLLSVMTLMTAYVLSSTREHRARLKDAGEQANVLAHLDPLTGMANRRAFDQALALAIEGLASGEQPTSLLLCDVNSFKQVNDRFGHAVGDEVLCSIATALTDAVRGPDAAFRWAGDEFAVILSNTDEIGAAGVAARLRDTVTRLCRHPDGSEVTIGTGVAQLKPGMSSDDILIGADRALFLQKSHRGHLRGVA